MPILCNGDEELHYELRARVTCELTLHKQYYLRDDVTSSMIDSHGNVIMKNSLMGTSSQFYSTEACVNVSGGSEGSGCKLEAVFRETAKISSFSCMWHVHGLSTVVSTPIMSVYPQYDKRLHPAYNRMVYPRGAMYSITQSSTCTTMAIMWSRTAPPLNLDWNPNHFVPLVKIDHMHKHMMSVTVASTDTVSTICTGSTLSSCNTFTNSTTKLSVPALSSILAATNTAKQPIYATLDSYVSSNHCHKRSLQDRDTSRAQQRRQKITGPANEPSLATIFLKNQQTEVNRSQGKKAPFTCKSMI